MSKVFLAKLYLEETAWRSPHCWVERFREWGLKQKNEKFKTEKCKKELYRDFLNRLNPEEFYVCVSKRKTYFKQKNAAAVAVKPKK